MTAAWSNGIASRWRSRRRRLRSASTCDARVRRCLYHGPASGPRVPTRKRRPRLGFSSVPPLDGRSTRSSCGRMRLRPPCPALHRLGITGTKLFHPLSQAGPGRCRTADAAAGLRWYTETLATDFYAPYHRWMPGRSVTWLFDQTKARHRRNPDDLTVFHRQTESPPDPVWLVQSRRGSRRSHARRPHIRPFFTTWLTRAVSADLAAAWDFDLSPSSLEGMRARLMERHGSLAALNRAWEPPSRPGKLSRLP